MSRRGTLAEEGKSRIAIAVSDAMTTNAVPLNALQADDLLGLVPRQLAAAGDGGATRRGMDEASLGLEEPRAPDAGALRAGRRGDARTCDRARDVYRRGAHPGVGCEARRARACGEHCRVPFGDGEKPKGACITCGRRSRSGEFADRRCKTFSASVQNIGFAPQAMSLKLRQNEAVEKARTRANLRRAAAKLVADQRAHTRVSTQEPLGSQETVRRGTARVVFLGTPTPSSVAARSPRASPDPRALEPRRAEPYL